MYVTSVDESTINFIKLSTTTKNKIKLVANSQVDWSFDPLSKDYKYLYQCMH